MRKLLETAARILFPVVILGAGIFGFYTLSNLRKPPPRERVERPLPLVETVAVRPHIGELPIEVDGNVVPFRLIPISSEVSGRVVFKSENCRSGRDVKKGDPLIRIDRTDYELEIERLTRQYEQSVALLEELSVQIDSAKQLVTLAMEDVEQREREFRRVEKLFGMDAATDVELDEARQSQRTARTALVNEQKGLRLLTTQQTRLEKARDLVETERRKARLDLSRTEITAPCDGTVVTDDVEEDSFVQRGTPLFTVNDSSAAEVTCRLTVDQLYWLWLHDDEKTAEPFVSPGDDPSRAIRTELMPQVPVTVVYTLAGQEFAWRGRLSRFEGTGLDDRTRTVPCRVLVPEPQSVSLLKSGDKPVAVKPPKLVRGMFVSLRMHSRPRMALLRIPEAAIRPGNTVWKVENGILERLEIEVARVADGVALVPEPGSGLRAGDRIVTSPLTTETSGQRVREQKRESTANNQQREQARQSRGAEASE